MQRLREGNERFVSEANSGERFLRRMLRARVISDPEPFAIILGCSDSRVPVELVFDQDLGDLFVIRVAGNIVAPSQLGSAEFAAEQFGTRLVVVLGHTHCGAIVGTLERLRRPTPAVSPHMRFIATHQAGGRRSAGRRARRRLRDAGGQTCAPTFASVGRRRAVRNIPSA